MPVPQQARFESQPKNRNTETPNIDDTIAAMNISGTREVLRVVVDEAADARSAPRRKKKSPTMAPITDAPAAMRSPVKIAGIAPGQLHLPQPGPAADLVEREQVVVSSVGGLQAEQRVGDHREDRDQHGHQQAARDAVAEPDREIGTSARIGSVWTTTAYGKIARSRPSRQVHDDGDRHAEHDRDRQADQRHLAGARASPRASAGACLSSQIEEAVLRPPCAAAAARPCAGSRS